MHVAEAQRGRGVGSALLDHIVATARTRGYARLSLETASFDYFTPARALYARHGFAVCGPFGDYPSDPNSVFLTLQL
jgi:putative acetyltransferase